MQLRDYRSTIPLRAWLDRDRVFVLRQAGTPNITDQQEGDMNNNVRGLLLVSLGVLGGCSSGPSGDYGGSDCGLYDKLSFRDNGKVYISMKMFGVQMGETAGDYTVDKDKVIVSANNQTTVFTMNKDGDLEGTMLGDKILCRKGAGDGGGSESAKSAGAAVQSASYGGPACIFDKMSFGNGNKVDLVVDKQNSQGTYSTKGDQVTVTGEGGSVTFTLNGNNLEVTVEGQHAVCSKL